MTGVKRKLEVVDDLDRSGLLRVAFATGDREIVDQHFGSARSFMIYGIDPEQVHLLTVCEFGDLAEDGNEDKLAVKLDALSDCIAVYCRACGASAVRQLMAVGVQPVKVSEGAPIDELIANLQQELQEGPSAWLAKAIARTRGRSASRFDAMEAEGWND